MFAILTLDENVLVTNLGNGSLLVELQVLEAASALHTPLLLGSGCHCVVIFGSVRIGKIDKAECVKSIEEFLHPPLYTRKPIVVMVEEKHRTP